MATRILILLSTIFAAADFYDKKSGVVELTGANFNDVVKQDGQVFLVEFYAPWCGHCKALTPEWLRAAKDLKGQVRVGAVNCDEEKNKALAAQFQIKGFPTIKLFVGKKSPLDYQGERKAPAIVQYALDHIPSLVKKVTDKNIEEFLSGEAGVPHALLFTDKKLTDTSTKVDSMKLKGRMLIGEVHSSQKAVTARYEITSFPTLLVVTPQNEVVVQSGGAVGTAASQFLRAHALPPPEGYVDPDAPAPLPRLHDDSCLQSVCVAEGGLCAIVFIRNRDHAQVEADKSVLAAARDLRTDGHFHFGWVEADSQPDFLTAFGLNLEEYPQVIVLSAKKGRFANHMGAYTAEGLGEFLSGVVKGKIRTFPIPGGLPKLVGDTKKCAKKSSSAPPTPPSPPRSPPSSSPKEPKEPKDKGAGNSRAVGSVVLTSKNFKELVLKSKGDWIVEFYAPWCGHCKNLAPHWKKAATNLKRMVHFGEVDATVETSLAQQYGVKGYPTIKVFRAADRKKAEDYTGGRTAKDLESYALNLLTSKHVHKVSDSKWVEWLGTKSELPHVLLLTQKPQISPLIKSLSVELLGEAVFGVSKHDQSQVAAAVKAEAFPSLFFIYPDAQDNFAFEKYSGDLNWQDIKTAVGKFRSSPRPTPVEDAAPASCGGEGGDLEHGQEGLCTAPPPM